MRLTEEDNRNIKKIKVYLECESDAEAISTGLAISETVIEAIFKGQSVFFKDNNNKFTELIIQGLNDDENGKC